MLNEFREYLMSQNKSQNLIDSYLQSVDEFMAWLSLRGKDPAIWEEQNIDESVSYTIFEGNHNIPL